MKYEIKEDGGRSVLVLREQMTYADRQAFDGLVPGLVKQGRAIVIDMAGLEYMDSAGLGMLLTLRDQADKARVKVSIRSAQGDVKELLRLSCFDTLFAFE
ncbi:putative Antagonist of anti-sigma factor [Rhodospirillaceae bacterium LM-1]|nr:putative Antagonist of anti-sigma factor [Rhodospirillaceae bacterium LM-1]